MRLVALSRCDHIPAGNPEGQVPHRKAATIALILKTRQKNRYPVSTRVSRACEILFYYIVFSLWNQIDSVQSQFDSVDII